MEGGRGREKYLQARVRGEELRAELVARLHAGPQTADDLLAGIDRDGVSLSEVAFQLDRLRSEGRVTGAAGEPYELTRGTERA